MCARLIALFPGQLTSLSHNNIEYVALPHCKEAGIQYGRKGGFLFHDLRHTAKTIARKAGVDKNVRMFIFCHSTSKDMDLRYDTVDEDDLINAIDRVEMYLQASEKQENSQHQKILPLS
jgi:integrase